MLFVALNIFEESHTEAKMDSYLREENSVYAVVLPFLTAC